MMLKFPKSYYETSSSKSRGTIRQLAATPEATQIVNKVADEAVSNDEPVAIKSPAEAASQVDTSWLPFAAKTYKISSDLSDYVIVNIPICPSDIPNRNGVAFPLAELIAYQPPPVARLTYKAWTGCPVHLEHENEDHEKAIGVIFDTSLRIMKGYGDGKHYVVYGLIGIDRTKDPETAEKFRTGAMDTGSMGALADYFTCSVCGHESTDNQFTNCAHIKSTKAVNWKIVDHEGKRVLAYLNAHVLAPIEFSAVADPAWATCLTDMVLAR